IDDALMAPGIEEFLARTEAQVGEADRAISRLEHLLTIPYGPAPITQALLRLDPSWDPLRNHPRFQKLVSGPRPKTIYKYGSGTWGRVICVRWGLRTATRLDSGGGGNLQKSRLRQSMLSMPLFASAKEMIT